MSQIFRTKSSIRIAGGDNGKGTAGCTATSPNELRAVMEWLDPKASPAFVQRPRTAYEKLRGTWELP